MSLEDGYRRFGTDGFATPASAQDLARRFRGRLPAPVTVWTAEVSGSEPAGITVSSMMVAEGEPWSITGLIGPLSPFWDAASRSRRFLVHVLGRSQIRLADQFAGRYPLRPFEGVEVEQTEFGPHIVGCPTFACCHLEDATEVGYFLMIRGAVEEVSFGPEEAPLVHYRGRYSSGGT